MPSWLAVTLNIITCRLYCFYTLCRNIQVAAVIKNKNHTGQQWKIIYLLRPWYIYQDASLSLKILLLSYCGMCERESVCVCVYIQWCAFRILQHYTSISSCPKFYSVFFVLNLHVKGKETCKETFTVSYDYCLDPNLWNECCRDKCPVCILHIK